MAPSPVSLTPDCSACASLCCVVFAFDRSESFGIDKGAGEVCPNLAPTGLCSIFETREQAGFKGCITYDCQGAGQRVTQEVFGGRHWRDDTALIPAMGEALSVLRRIHALLGLLETAASLPLAPNHVSALTTLQEHLSSDGWTEQSLRAFQLETAEREVHLLLRDLAAYVQCPSDAHS